MGIKLYDFDYTIYDGDSTLDFYFFCLRNCPAVAFWIPVQVTGFILYLLRFYDKARFKQSFFQFLNSLDNMDGLLTAFWKEHRYKLKQWYLEKDHDEDVVISASPEFLLQPVCEMVGIKMVIASRINQQTGIIEGFNCYGVEKVRRLNELFPEMDIDEFYSDALSDIPLAQLARKSYRVKKKTITNWYAK